MNMITSRNSELVKLASSLVKDPSYRHEVGLFVTEGEKVAREVLAAGITVKIFICTEKAKSKYPETVQKVNEIALESYMITEDISQKISDSKSPQGIYCLCEVIDNRTTIDTIDNNGKVILLDHIQDPGNLGTIIRSAVAFSVDLVVVAGGCDIYSPKVIRSTAGTVFKIPIFQTDNCVSAVNLLKNKGFSTFAGVPNHEKSLLLGTVNLSKGCAVVIGNEGAGINPETINACDYFLTIPMSGPAESLNAAVAASLIMWEMSKHEKQQG